MTLNPHPLCSDAAVKAYHLATNSPNQVWINGPSTPPAGNVTPNTLAINLIQSLVEGRVVVEGDQISHIKGAISSIQAKIHASPKKTITFNKTSPVEIVLDEMKMMNAK